ARGPVNSYGGLRFSPDGKLLTHCYRANGRWQLRVWRLGDQPVAVVRDRAAVVSTSFRADSRQIAVCHAGGEVHLYDTTTGQAQRRLDGGPGAVFVAFHPKEPRLLALSRTEVRIFDAQTGALVRSL